MARKAHPWFRRSDGWWYVKIKGRQQKLARGRKNRQAALDRWHELMLEVASNPAVENGQHKPSRGMTPNPDGVWMAQVARNMSMVFGEEKADHLRHILKSWLTHYHSERPHQGLGNVPINTDLPPPVPVDRFRWDDVVCHESLGGLLKHYQRRAA